MSDRSTAMGQPDNQTTLEEVRRQYAAVARSGLDNNSASIRSVASAFGYTPEQLASLPPQANMGLSCGNPVALAGLKPGEVVVDLGCGGGIDVLLAAQKVGPEGRAIGIDMTPDMLERARHGARQTAAQNVEFHLAEIDRLPLADNTVDCIISNCVINLVPDKPRVLAEALRVLKPGGRIAISDIALRQPLPPGIRDSIEAWVGCIAGAILIDDYSRLLHNAGFESVVIRETGADLNAYAAAGSSNCCAWPEAAGTATVGSGCCGAGPGQSGGQQLPLVHDHLAALASEFDANAYAASLQIHALKPAV